MYLPTMQPVSNQVIGTVIAAMIKRQRYQRAAAVPAGDNNYQPPVYFIDAIPVSVITQEVYQYQSDVTRHAVESNVNFSDHVIQNPLQIEMEFEVSNYDGLGPQANFAKTALDRAVAVWEGRQLFSLQTTHRLIQNVVCVSLRAVNEAPQWGKLGFHAVFQEVRLVTLQTSQYQTEQVQGAPVVNSDPLPVASATPPGGPNSPKSNMAPATPARKNLKIVTDLFSQPPSVSSFEFVRNLGL